MYKWIHIKDEKPEEGRDLFYFFDVLGVYRGKYERYECPIDIFGAQEDGTPYYSNTFYSEKGWLSDDVTHWMYADGWEEGQFPDIPEDYVETYDPRYPGKGGYTHKDDTVLVDKKQFDGIMEVWKQSIEGRVFGRVCPECPVHIFWSEEKNGYMCGSCFNVYPKDEVEITDVEKYLSCGR